MEGGRQTWRWNEVGVREGGRGSDDREGDETNGSERRNKCFGIFPYDTMLSYGHYYP